MALIVPPDQLPDTGVSKAAIHVAVTLVLASICHPSIVSALVACVALSARIALFAVRAVLASSAHSAWSAF